MKKEQRGDGIVWVITITALLLAGIIGEVVWRLVNSEKPPITWLEYVGIAFFSAVCITLLIFSQANRILFWLEKQEEELEEQRKDLIVVNGFSLKAITKIIAFTLMVVQTEIFRIQEYAMAKKFDTGFDLTEDEARVKFPESIQENLDLIHGWLNSPTHQKGYKTWEELTEFLELARERVEDLKKIVEQ